MKRFDERYILLRAMVSDDYYPTSWWKRSRRPSSP